MELCKIIKVIYIKFMNKREAEIINDAVVEELKKLRNKHKISQYKIAKDTGLSKSTISRIESFQQKPTLMVLYIIADYLQEDLGKILSYIYSAYKNK